MQQHVNRWVYTAYEGFPTEHSLLRWCFYPRHHDLIHFYFRVSNGNLTANPSSSGDFPTNWIILAITVECSGSVGYQRITVKVWSHMNVTTWDFKRIKDTWSCGALSVDRWAPYSYVMWELCVDMVQLFLILSNTFLMCCSFTEQSVK